MKNTCKTCRFFLRVVDQNNVLAACGVCYEAPPQVTTIAIQTATGTGLANTAARPKIEDCNAEWCGRWQSAKAELVGVS